MWGLGFRVRAEYCFSLSGFWVVVAMEDAEAVHTDEVGLTLLLPILLPKGPRTRTIRP